MRNLAILVFLWRDSILFFERTVKTGVIAKTAAQVNIIDGDVCCHGFPAECKPLLCDVLVDGNAQIILKNMRNVIFAHKKGTGKPVQGKLFIQMLFDIFAQTLKKRRLLRLDFRVVFRINDTVQEKKEIIDAERQLSLAAEAAAMHFF